MAMDMGCGCFYVVVSGDISDFGFGHVSRYVYSIASWGWGWFFFFFFYG
jgi:hypothetical protein